jgi:hypothetical protein
VILDGAVRLDRMAPSFPGNPMKKDQTRDELMLFNAPRHTLPTYVAAHQMAGDLELVKEDQPAQKPSEQVAVFDRLTRQVPKGKK